MEPREWLRFDEERRLSREYQALLLEGAPREGAIRERGEIMSTIPDPGRSERIREQAIEYLNDAYGYMNDAQPGMANYPRLNSSASDVDGFDIVWRSPSGHLDAGAFTAGGTPVRIPDELREVARAYQHNRETPEERGLLLAWWRERHHEVERAEVEGIAVRANLPPETRREVVGQIQCELARHRVERRLCYASGPERGVSFTREDALPLSSEGARSLNRQRADLPLTTAIAAASVRNPDALVGLVRMPDTGRLLTQAEILRGALDVARGGGEQFHIEALAVKEAVRPLARDPEAYERRFAFAPPSLPGVPFLVRTLTGQGARLHFEDPFGKRLEEFNEQVRSSRVGGGDHPARWEDRWLAGAAGPEVGTHARVASGVGARGTGEEGEGWPGGAGAPAKAGNVSAKPGPPAPSKGAEPCR